MRDRGGDQARVMDRREIHEPDAIGEIARAPQPALPLGQTRRRRRLAPRFRRNRSELGMQASNSAARRARRVFPVPAGPVSVTRRMLGAHSRSITARIGRLPTSPVHPRYAAIVAKAHVLGLPQCFATDITIHDRLLIARRQTRQFAWLLHCCGSQLSLPEPNGRPTGLSSCHATALRP
jgi:hypothetical protein